MGDLQFRKNSIPYLGQIYGYNRNEKSDDDISWATAYGDLQYIANPTTIRAAYGYGGSYYPQKDNYIRILRPQRSEIVAAYLSIALKMDSSEPNSLFYVTVTKTTSETDLTVITLSDADIIRIHTAIKGNSDPFSNTAGQLIQVYKLDLTSFIPKFGSADFRSDCYVVGIHFKTTPVAAGFHLYKFQVDGSALVVR